MSETGFRIFNSVFSAGAELTYALLLTAFFKPFIPSQGRKWRKLLLAFYPSGLAWKSRLCSF